jgi:hypothetical protein
VNILFSASPRLCGGNSFSACRAVSIHGQTFLCAAILHGTKDRAAFDHRLHQIRSQLVADIPIVAGAQDQNISELVEFEGTDEFGGLQR